MSTDLHQLAAPYALDALEADERARFEAHLAGCDTCRAELDGFLSTTDRLGAAAAATPPADLRDRVLTTASTLPQERPVVSALATRSRFRRVAPRLVLAAAVAAAAVGIGGFVVERQRVGDLRAERADMTAVMTADDATMSAADATGGGTLRVISSQEHDAAVVVGVSLPELDDDREYQVWHLQDGKPTSVGMLGDGPGMLYVDGIRGAEAYAVSVEPVGGSEQPTTDPIAATPMA